MCDRGVPFHAGGTRSAVPRRMRPPTLRALVRVVPLTFVAGCAATMPFSPLTPATVSSGMPLGPSYMLVAAPADDASLLGCTASDSPGRGWSDRRGRSPRRVRRKADTRRRPRAPGHLRGHAAARAWRERPRSPRAVRLRRRPRQDPLLPLPACSYPACLAAGHPRVRLVLPCWDPLRRRFRHDAALRGR